MADNLLVSGEMLFSMYLGTYSAAYSMAASLFKGTATACLSLEVRGGRAMRTHAGWHLLKP